MTAREWFWTEGHQAEGVALTDRGILYGEGLFETFLLHRGRPFRLEEHLARMRCSAAALEIPLPRPRWEARVTAGLRQLVERSGISQGRVRLTLTAGAAGPSGDPAQPAAGPGRLLLRLAPYTPPVAGLSGWRVLPAGPPVAGVRGSPPSHKSLSYLGNLLCLRQARRKGAQEGLLHTKD
ncbi:MAG: aminotransferase class IV, partial [Acidobacteriota bacterium]